MEHLLIIETVCTGELYVTRFDLRAKIQSATNNPLDPFNVGDQEFHHRLLYAPGPEPARNKKDRVGVPTDDIPLACPYWLYLVAGLTYPSSSYRNISRQSNIDGARSLILVEANGQVTVCR